MHLKSLSLRVKMLTYKIQNQKYRFEYGLNGGNCISLLNKISAQNIPS